MTRAGFFSEHGLEDTGWWICCEGNSFRESAETHARLSPVPVPAKGCPREGGLTVCRPKSRPGFMFHRRYVLVRVSTICDREVIVVPTAVSRKYSHGISCGPSTAHECDKPQVTLPVVYSAVSCSAPKGCSPADMNRTGKIAGLSKVCAASLFLSFFPRGA